MSFFFVFHVEELSDLVVNNASYTSYSFMISDFFFISYKSNKRNSSVLYEFTDKWPGLLWKHLALKRLSADFCHYMIATFVYMTLWGAYQINMSNVTPLCFAKIVIFWMSNERGEGQAYLPDLWHIDFSD